MIRHHHHPLKHLHQCQAQAQRRALRHSGGAHPRRAPIVKIFILIVFAATLARPAQAGSKSKEKSSKTTVIAISSQGPGKAHPVPVPWPVVHCHHHHHHLKYVPKPVLVHHWVKKYKPEEIEASNESYQVMGAPDQNQHHNAIGAAVDDRIMASSYSNSYQAAPAHMVAPMLPPGPPNLIQAGPLSQFGQAEQSKLSFDLMDGNRLVTALSNTFDPAFMALPKSPVVEAPQVAAMSPGEQSTSRLGRPKAAAPANLNIREPDIEGEIRKHQSQQQQKKRTSFKEPQFSQRQLDKLTKTIRTVQQQQRSFSDKSQVRDTDSTDSLKSNVVAPDSNSSRPTLIEASGLGDAKSKVEYPLADSDTVNVHASMPPPSSVNPFNEHRESQGASSTLNSSPATSHLTRANQREEVEAMMAFERLSLDQAHRLAVLNNLDQQRQRVPLTQQVVPAPSYQMSSAPHSVSARVASALSESHTINLMTRLAERMVQQEAKNLIAKQSREQKEGQASPVALAPKGLFSSRSLRSLFSLSSRPGSLPKSSRDRRRSSSAFKSPILIPRNHNQVYGSFHVPLMTNASEAPNSLVWSNHQQHQRAPVAPAFLTGTARASPSGESFVGAINDYVITASPLNLSLFQSSGRAINLAASSRFMNKQRPTSVPQVDKLISEDSMQVNNLALPSPDMSEVNSTLKFHTGAQTTSVAQQTPPPSQAPVSENSLMTPDQESRFYSGQREHLLKSRQTAGEAAQPSQISLQLQAQLMSRTRPQKMGVTTQSSDGLQSIVAPSEHHYTVEELANGPRQVDATGQASAAGQQANPSAQYGQFFGRDFNGQSQEQQPYSADQFGSWLEFPVSPAQWSNEALKSINGPQRQQTDASSNSSQNEDSTPGDENQQPVGEGETSSSDRGEQKSKEQADAEQQTATNALDMSQYELVDSPTQSPQAPASFYSSANAPMGWHQQAAAASQQSPYGYYTAGQQQQSSSFPPVYAGHSMFMDTRYPLSQMLASPASHSQASDMMSTSVQALAPGAIQAELNLNAFPPISKKNAAKIASLADPQASLVSQSLAQPMNEMANIRQFHSSLGQAVASQAGNLTGMSALSGSLRNQMQARFPPQMPQVPNIPQPPQLPNLPMPPPGMMQMAASMALPLAMARVTRNSNRFRNQQVNAAAGAGGTTGTTPGQRLLRGASNITNRFMRPRRRPHSSPATSGSSAGSGQPARRRPLFNFAGSSPVRSPSGVSNSNRRRPVASFFQTVVDMSRRPQPLAAAAVKLATSAATSGVLSAAKASSAIKTIEAAGSAAPAVLSAVSAAASAAASGSSNSSPGSSVASGVAQAMTAAAVNKLKAKSDAGAGTASRQVRRESRAPAIPAVSPLISSRLARSLESFQQDLRVQARKQQKQLATSGGIFGGGLPPVTLTDGNIATFASMNSPVDLLNRQLEMQRQRRAREPSRAHQFLLLDSGFQAPHIEQMRLSARPLIGRELKQQVGMTAGAVGSPTGRLEILSESGELPQIEGLALNVSRAPLVANHFNLLMFTAQNVTGFKARPAGQESEQPNDLAAGVQGQHQEQQADSQRGEYETSVSSDEITRQQQPPAPTEIEFGDHLSAAGIEQQAASRVQSGPPTDATTTPMLQESLPTPSNQENGSSNKRSNSVKMIGEENVIASETSTAPPALQKRHKRKRLNAGTSDSSTAVAHDASTTTSEPSTSSAEIAPTSSTSASHGASNLNVSEEPAAVACDQRAGGTTTTAPQMHFVIKGNRMSQLKTKRSTSAKPTRRAAIDRSDPLTDDNLLATLQQQSHRTLQTATGALETPTQTTVASQTLASDTDSSQMKARPTPPVGDYVRAIKLVRGLSYPWPPPTQSSKSLAQSS